MSLMDTLRSDLTAAMRSRDTLTTSTLRLAITAIREQEVAGDEARTLSDDEVRQVLAREAKKRAEASETYRAAGRVDRADSEAAEEKVLASYLPAGLTPAELTALVDEVLAEEGLTARSQMGQAMRAVNARVAGRADGRAVADLVKARLS
jgi:uncharacterized protein